MFGKKEIVTIKVGVEGMMCQHCVAHVKNALESIKGVKEAVVDLEAQSATVLAQKSVSQKNIEDAIVQAGYKVK